MNAAPRSLKIRIGGVVEAQPFPYTYEEQFVVRFPPAAAAQIRRELCAQQQPEDLKIVFSDERHASVTVHGRRYAAVLLDLPTILETQKTFDRAQYYKIGDISQILLVLPDDDGGAAAAAAAEYERSDWQFPDGLTPPLRSVRTRRFKHTTSYGQQKDVEDIERRVQALLDRDSQATTSTFTVYDSSGRAILSGGGADGKIARGSRPLSAEDVPAEGEVDEDDDDPDHNDLDADADADADNLSIADDGSGESSGDEEFAAELEEEMLAEESSLPSSSLLPPAPSPAVLELHAKINERKAQLASVTNPLIRARLEDVIRQLEGDLHARL